MFGMAIGLSRLFSLIWAVGVFSFLVFGGRLEGGGSGGGGASGGGVFVFWGFLGGGGGGGWVLG